MKSKESNINLLIRQLSNFFEVEDEEKDILRLHYETVIHRLEGCFSKIKNKYYNFSDNTPLINCTHSAQYLSYLYFYSNIIYHFDKREKGNLCDKIYYLNKIMNSVELYYAVELPDVFFCDHPLGAVMGRAKYSNYFQFAQGCTVGNNYGNYPLIGEYVRLCPNSMIIGKCRIGNHVILSVGSIVKDEDIEDNTIVFGVSPNLVKKKYEKYIMEDRFREQWY